MEQDKNKIVHPEDLIKYYSDGSAKILMDNILTTDQVIYPGMMFMKFEGIHLDIIKILEIWDEKGYIYIQIKDNKTGKIETISHRIGADYYAWTLISYGYMAEEYILKNLKKRMEIEFDF